MALLKASRGGISRIIQGFEKFGERMAEGDVGGAMRELGGGFIGGITTFAKRIVGGGIRALQKIFESVSDGARWVGNTARQFWGGARESASRVWEGAKEAASRAWEGVKDVARSIGKAVRDAVRSVADTIGGWFSPVAIDLNKDGTIEYIAREDSAALVDIDADGYLEQVGWIGPNDGFLVMDINNNQRVDTPEELAFATQTDAEDTDLQAFATLYDSNRDGVFDSRDTHWAKAGIWRDLNSDGKFDAGEFITMAQAGITSITLTSDGEMRLEKGNIVHGSATVHFSGGSTAKLDDVDLAASTFGYRKIITANGVEYEFENPQGGTEKFYRHTGASAVTITLSAQGYKGAIGGAGHDVLSAGTAMGVLLSGGAGNDILNGGAGADFLIGKIVGIFEDMQSRHQPRRKGGGGWPALSVRSCRLKSPSRGPY